MTHDPPASDRHLPLPVAAAQLGITATALIEAALQGHMILSVWQPGWTYTGVLFGADFDVETFTPVEEVTELEQPYALRPGLIALERHQLDQLRSGRVRIRSAGDVVSGFEVLLANPVELGWDSVLVDPSDGAWKQNDVVGEKAASRPPRGGSAPAGPTMSVAEAGRLLGRGRKATLRIARDCDALIDTGGKRGLRVLRKRLEAGLEARAGAGAGPPPRRASSPGMDDPDAVVRWDPSL